MRTLIAVSLGALLIAACGQQSAEPAHAATPEVSIYAAAVASESRSDADRETDTRRNPEAVLEFFGIQPGDTVLEMWAGGGYYTELLSLVVGETGKVLAHANTPMVNFTGEEQAARRANNRLPNTEVLMAENNELSLQPNSVDAVTIILNYHDLYWSSEEYGWEKIDVPVFLAELFKGLKPGGVLGIVDHQAVSGSPPDTGNTLHRIDSDYVIAELEDAGFIFDGESDALRNPADDHTSSVFDESIRGKTDRFVLKFRKP